MRCVYFRHTDQMADQTDPADYPTEWPYEDALPPDPDYFPKSYESCRITAPHAMWDTLHEKVFHDFEWYISYAHKGKNGNNEHFHVLIPSSKSNVQRVRDRLKKLDLTGNKCISIKHFENGITCGIQYASREDTTPVTQGDVREWIDAAPGWINVQHATSNTTVGVKRKAEDPLGTKLTAANHLRYAWDYRKQMRFPANSLPATLAHMLDDGYYIDPAWARQGVPDFYKDVFDESIKVGHLTWKPSIKSWSGALWRPVSSRW